MRTPFSKCEIALSGNVYQFDRYFREEKDASSCLMFSNVASLALWAAFLVA
jgi:hypothetical protein